MMPAFAVDVLAPWDSHLQALHRHFYAAADDQCLLWVNPAQGDPFAEVELVAQRKVAVPISHPNFDVKFAPYLVPLTLSNSGDADLFKTSVAMAWDAWSIDALRAMGGQPIGGWVHSMAAPQALARYWATSCHLHPAGRLHKLLRFHDPGVREWLWATLSPMQRQQLLGPATSVHAIGRAQTLAQQTQLASDAAAMAGPLVLSPEQWQQVDDYATLHRAWLLCCQADPQFRAALARTPDWYAAILAALVHATRYGIRDAQDRELFATHALQLGSQFHQHPSLQAVWPLTRAGDFYGGALEQVLGHPADQLSIHPLGN